MAMLDTAGKFVLISLETPDSFIFELFPHAIQSTDHANWEAQDVSRGTKPLFYANGEPRKISVPECWLDGTEKNQPVNDSIDKLRALKNEIPKTGAPPALLAIWGDRQQRCVMEDVMIEEQFFTSAGNPLRARVTLQL